MLEKDFLKTLKFDSKNCFLKIGDSQVSFRDVGIKISKAISNLSKLNLSKESLVLVDIREPLDFISYVFACFQLKLKPALLNFYFKKPQIETLLKANSYSAFITDQDYEIFHTKIQTLKSGSSSQELNIDLNSEVIFFTSGSIESKACVLTLKNFFYNAKGSAENIPFVEADTWGLCLPLFHVGGFSILVRSILSQGSVAVLENSISLSKQMDALSVTHVSLVSLQFLRLLEERIPSGLKHILLGGSAIPENALKRAIQLHLPIYKSYGMTEMASQISTSKKLESFDDLHLSGNILSYRELKLVDKNIYVKGPCLFSGYLKNNVLEKTTDNDGWFWTHDYGIIHEGKLQILGRSDRIFQSAGENISPEVIEQELLRIPGIHKAYVCPEIDSKYGAKPVAYIERTDVSDDTIYKYLEHKLSGLYRPVALKEWSLAPRNSWKQ